MTSEKTVKNRSKFLSLVLRHRPELIGISLDDLGWTDVDQLLTKLRQFGKELTMEELIEVVETNTKSRFAFNADATRIRASQGHSVKVDLGYKPEQPPEILYHGTAEKNLASILKKGITKRSRHHVHLSANEATAKTVGSRHGKPLILKVQANQMYLAGMTFYLSENQVWLTDYVDPKYILVE